LRRYFDTAQAMLLRIIDHPAATIAAVRGLAVAGGLELVCACDLAVAGTEATFADGHLVHGLLPAGASSELLRRIVGERWGRWMLLSGEPVTAQMAEHMGLVNSVVADGELEATVERMAATLSQRPASAVRAMKRLLRPDVEHILAAERRELLAHLAHPDVRQSLQAFDRRLAATMAEPA
jgi:enoyl-CoA hydratase/carnithine racemase